MGKLLVALANDSWFLSSTECILTFCIPIFSLVQMAIFSFWYVWLRCVNEQHLIQEVSFNSFNPKLSIPLQHKKLNSSLIHWYGMAVRLHGNGDLHKLSFRLLSPSPTMNHHHQIKTATILSPPQTMRISTNSRRWGFLVICCLLCCPSSSSREVVTVK